MSVKVFQASEEDSDITCLLENDSRVCRAGWVACQIEGMEMKMLSISEGRKVVHNNLQQGSEVRRNNNTKSPAWRRTKRCGNRRILTRARNGSKVTYAPTLT
jgi:hypothetical protein